MCGIVGYIGKLDARKIVLDGLTALEYRGYDSAGIALKKDDKVEIFKDKGRVDHLKSIVDTNCETHLAIGHTRWATHGVPSLSNSHPHTSNSGRFILVHNGVIENYKQLKVTKLGNYTFKSETDTEVIVNLIEHYAKRDMPVERAIRTAISLLEGSYALLIIDTKDLNKIYFAKNKTPMLIGVGDEGMTIASDTLALVGYASKYTYLNDKTFGFVNEDSLQLFDITGNEEEIEFLPLNIDASNVGKASYDHYMLKEIDEQPGIIRALISHYFDDDESINIDENVLNKIRNSDHIYICACGTSYHAGLVAKYYFEKLCRIPTSCLIASEAAYDMPLISKKPFFIFVSQSGETADVISVIKKCKEASIPNLALTNSPLSSIDNLADSVIHLLAGKEISVASTKAYIAQVVTFSILARAVSMKKTNLRTNLNNLALAVENIFASKDLIKSIAEQFKDAKDAFYIGRGLDYSSSLEAALKLKEISYIHTEGFASGELKHGSIALIEKDTPVIALCTCESTNAITRSNLIETKARGAKGFVIATKSCSHSDDDIIVPDVASYLTPVVTVVVCQLIAYYAATLRGHDVDKPRNLAKSVTVE